jgi:uncharacterized RDD family membrane protein YckC
MKGTAALLTVVLAFVGVGFAAVCSFFAFMLWRAEPGSPIEPVARVVTAATSMLALGSFVTFPLLLSAFIDKGPPAVAVGRPLATFRARALARVFDDLVVLFPLTLVLWGRLDQADGGFLIGTRGCTVWAVVATVLNNGLLEWIGGTSVGKFLFRVQVIDVGGGRITGTQALVRNLARVVDNLLLFPAGVLALIDSPLRQRLGDRWAKTIVVRAGIRPAV